MEIKIVNIYGTKGWTEVEALKEQGYSEAFWCYCFNTLTDIGFYKP